MEFESKQFPDRLQHVEVSYVTNDDCENMYKLSGFPFFEETMLCAMEVGKDAWYVYLCIIYYIHTCVVTIPYLTNLEKYKLTVRAIVVDLSTIQKVERSSGSSLGG